METRQRYHQELEELYQSVLRMGALVEEQVTKSLVALGDGDGELAASVIEGDKEIDRLLVAVEDRATEIIAMQQPVAGDLREIITVIKIGGHLERIGDHARHFSRAVNKIPQAILDATLPDMKSMAQIGTSMVRDALGAFSEHDAAKATSVAERDNQIDVAHKQLYAKLINLVKREPEETDAIVNLLFLNRFLERLGDHVTNVCEWVVFAQTGKHPKLNP